MDNYYIEAEVMKTEEYQADTKVWKIQYKYYPNSSGYSRSSTYLMPKTLTPPRVGDKIKISISL